MVERDLEHKKKSMALAYVFLIFLGTFGAHRFYVGKKGTAITQFGAYTPRVSDLLDLWNRVHIFGYRLDLGPHRSLFALWSCQSFQ